MYEDQTYEILLARALAKVATDVDKREGSLIMNAIAPVSAEHANIYILLDSIIRNGYIDTADIREYVVARCRERGINPYEATKAVLKGKFNMEVPIGSRYSYDELNYIAKAFIGSETGEDEVTYFYYQMECETAGVIGNTGFGELTSIEYISKDLTGELVELLIPAEDDEDIDSLKERYLGSFDSNPYGGNKQDYKDKTKALDGVGGCIVIPVWNGGGTVKLIIIDSDFNKASTVLVDTIQEKIDPNPQGEGNGIAPIGHTVTVTTPDNFTVNISVRLTLNEGYTWSQIKPSIEEVMEAYFLELRQAWEEEHLVVRISQVENRILNLDGVLDVADTKLNGVAGNLSLEIMELPVFGEVSNSG